MSGPTLTGVTGLEPALLPPSAPEIEEVVLGAILYHADACMPEIGDLLHPEVFYVHAHQLIYRAIAALYAKAEPVDILTVVQQLKRDGNLDIVGGAFYVSSLTNRVASTKNAPYHTMILLQEYIARETIRLNNEASRRAADPMCDVLDVIPDTIAKMEASIAATIKRRAVRYHDHEREQIRRMDEPQMAPLTTGFAELDNVIRPAPGDLGIIAGRPGMGKSSLAISMCREIAATGTAVGLISMELTETQCQARFFARESGVPVEDILHGRMTADQIQRRHEALERTKALPLWIRYDTGLNVTDIRAEVTRLVKSHNVRVVIIDQLTWVKLGKAQTRDIAIGELTRALKIMAVQLEVCVILLHQLNRAVETRGGDKRPQLSDLRDSGNIEQDAQFVLFPYRPEYYGITEDDQGSTIGIVDVMVAKNSNGSTGQARLRFEGPTASIRSFVEQAKPYNPRQGFDHNRVTPERDDDFSPF